MQLAGTLIAQVKHVNAESRQHVGDDTPVTTPPEKFSTHDGGSKSTREHEELIETIGEFFGGDVIRIRSKGGMAPGLIARA